MLPKGPYNPKETEAEMLKFWLENEYYKPEYVSEKKLSTAYKEKNDIRETYTNILPPPNANGNLHLGHMSGYAYQDMMGRFQRMKGKKVLLLPGKDHAGIQTEVVFENELAKKGKSKRDLGRETFYKACYKFCMDNADVARNQEKKLGLSADYSRELFTLDPRVVNQILGTFIDLYHDGLVYRDKRLINWCVRCQSALADIDTEYKESEGTFIYFKYAFTKTDGTLKVDKYALALKEKFEEKTVEVEIERKKGLKINPDKGEEYEWPFDYYGFIKEEINPNDKEDLDVILIGFEDNLQVGDKVTGKVIGLMMRMDGDYKLYVIKEGTSQEVIDFALKERFEGFSKHFGGVQNRIFSVHTKPEHYSNGFVIGTVRPETIFGDTGIAVHPDDERYKEYIGKELELIGPQGKTKLKVVASKNVDPEFGTGVLKVTPAHATEDWDIAVANKELFPEKQCINFDGKLNHLCGKYEGMPTKDARKVMLEDMQESGLLVQIQENYTNRIQICERCKNPIEPLVSYQWFLNTRPLKEKAKQLVNSGITEIMPEGKKNVYLNWMDNPEDWCITRQLWWGYRVPVWYKYQPKEYITKTGEVKEQIGDKIMTSRDDYKDMMEVSITPPGQEINVIRHGESEGNVLGVTSGRTDHKLTKLGEKEAIEFAKNSDGQFDLILTSTLSRSIETGEIIAKELGIKDIIHEELICERNFGDYENKKKEDLQKEYPDYNSVWQDTIPNGETIADVEQRVDKFIELFKKKYSTKKVLIVTHMGIIRVLLRKLGGKTVEESREIQIGNCQEFKFIVPEEGWIQDEDVFDTWFSSGQWPAVTLAVNNTCHPDPDLSGEVSPLTTPDDFSTFYPTQVMETGWDILIFWVTRMMLLCPYKATKLKALSSQKLDESEQSEETNLAIRDLVGSKNLDSRLRGNDNITIEDDTQVSPFKYVYLHGLVLDKNGIKMSKSKGNGIDPFEMMQKYGTDALRMSFIFGNKAGQNYRLYEEKIETFRNYCNKLWNMSKFVLMSLENIEFDVAKVDEYKKHVTTEDEVMINKIDMLQTKITRNMESFQFGVAIQDLYESSWHEFADVFIEQIKSRIYTKDKEGNPVNTSAEAVNSRMAAMYTLWYCLTMYLKMLHPFIPFITERIWKEMPKDTEESETLMYSAW